MMTWHEKELVGALGDCWDQFMKLPVEHNDDIDEFRRGIHQLQEKVLARSGRRQMNGVDD